jgi:acyl-coenzyme A synthetase/AMP-(fatty) acid ligase
MLPQRIIVADAGLPRNANGKIDRKLLGTQWLASFAPAPA